MKRAAAWLGALLCCAAVARPDAAPPSNSIYQLDARLTAQDGREHGLDLYRGHPVLVTMFYGSCPASCPLIIDTLRATEQGLAPAQRAELRVLMISIDPARDTAAALAGLAKTRRIDTTRWTLARTDEATVRSIAALLNLQYRKLPDGEFNHSTVIALLSPQGVIEASSGKLGTPDTQLLAKLGGQ